MNSKRVLVVEDDAKTLKAMKMALELQGHVVSAFATAASAAAANASEIDAAIIDLRLPDGPGADFGRMMRRKHPNLRIIFVTGFRINDVLGAVPGAPVLIKPICMESLLHLL